MKSLAHFKVRKIIMLFLAAALAVSLGIASSSAAEEVVVKNPAITPYDTALSVSWDALSSATDPVISYEVHYGIASVSEKLAKDYDTTLDTKTTETTYILRNLTNGVRYYIAVGAILKSGAKTTALSEEVFSAPASVYADAPAAKDAKTVEPVPQEDCTVDDKKAPQVKEAKALTKDLVKVTFSECITLPDLFPELNFSIKESADEKKVLPVSAVEYKIDYKGEKDKEEVHKNILFVTLKEKMTRDVKYAVSVGAAIVDLQKNPIESGATDSAYFTGTDALEIPEAEKPLVSKVGEEPKTEVKTEEKTGPDSKTEVSKDTTPPENVTDLKISSTPRLKDFLLSLSWKKSTSSDVDHQTVYESTDKGKNWVDGVKLEKDTEKYDTSGKPETEHTTKVSATDTSGNENSGTIESIRLPALPQTGAPLSLAALASALYVVIRRRQKK
ncbi:fibronectin type III domain-containing protein [Candidatus Peregrinibacteria bacterium]|nr:fibronectin type III domain-containing protein [Candidatus Peregrinibacteria bacterium]